MPKTRQALRSIRFRYVESGRRNHQRLRSRSRPVTGQSFGGDVHLRVLAANAAYTVAGPIIGAKSVELEAYQTYSLGAGGTIDQTAMTLLQNMFNGISVAVPAGLANVSNLHVRGGIEIDFAGDITVNNGGAGWDFSTWRSSNGEPGYLTIRAAGNVDINSSLSDGFTGVTTYDFRCADRELSVDSDNHGIRGHTLLSAAQTSAPLMLRRCKALQL